jgi:hypothetical protein
MNYPTSSNFSKHSENLAEVSAAIVQVERSHKSVIKDGDEAAERALRIAHTMLIAVFAEAQLRKIVDDPTGFSDAERELIWEKKSQDERWKRAIEVAVSKHYGASELDLTALEPDDARRVRQVLNLIKNNLAPIITDRNKLAHGQWRWQLKSQSDDKFLVDPMRLDYNYEEIVGRYLLLKSIAQMVHVFCVSEPTFRRDFDHWAKKIEVAEQRSTGSSYSLFKDQLRRSHAAGKKKRLLKEMGDHAS